MLNVILTDRPGGEAKCYERNGYKHDEM